MRDNLPSQTLTCFTGHWGCSAQLVMKIKIHTIKGKKRKKKHSVPQLVHWTDSDNFRKYLFHFANRTIFSNYSLGLRSMVLLDNRVLLHLLSFVDKKTN